MFKMELKENLAHCAMTRVYRALTEHCKTEPPMRSTSLLEIGGTFCKCIVSYVTIKKMILPKI